MKILNFLVICFLLAGCATAYQPEAWSGGFQDEKLESDTYEIWFGGNANTKKERVMNFALLRSAELTLEEGYDYFTILEDKTDSKSTDVGDWYGHTNIIRCFREKPADMQITIYDAEQVRDSLRLKYNLNRN